MNPEENSDLNAATLVALRSATDAVRIITERLKVKEMGPADHIRTKHEVKAFVENAGDLTAAEDLLQRARIRREVTQKISMKISQGQSQRITE
jgi:ABC-type dipeptide/oligopeptide/nickel transport system ATPase subunit